MLNIIATGYCVRIWLYKCLFFYVVDKMYFKVVMVGSAAVGKTTLAIVLITSEKGPAEHIPTVCE